MANVKFRGAGNPIAEAHVNEQSIPPGGRVGDSGGQRMPSCDTFIEMISKSGATRKISYNIISGNAPIGIFWMCGFLSNMRSRKVSAVARWCHEKDYTLTRFDYSGRGSSDGLIEDGSVSQWLDETKAVFTEKTQGPQILVGSSMGGWLALLLMTALAKSENRFVGCILMAPAWNMTQALMWEKFASEIREEINTRGAYYHPSAYGNYAITKHLIEDGQQHLIRPEDISLNCPLAILQGMQDPIVPWQRSLEFAERSNHNDLVLEFIKDGDHSLSRDKDLARLFLVLEGMVNRSLA
jgi:alpha-beta hydrolase superfamily lysophospholipase